MFLQGLFYFLQQCCNKTLGSHHKTHYICKTKANNMQTYSTIQEAFKNGSGDVFYFKGGETMQYIALSRHVDHYATMFELGFELLSYDEVLAIAAQDKKESEKCKVATATHDTKAGYIHISISSPFDEFYAEFPDAYGQNL